MRHFFELSIMSSSGLITDAAKRQEVRNCGRRGDIIHLGFLQSIRATELSHRK
jgi:hypothetical protein